MRANVFERLYALFSYDLLFNTKYAITFQFLQENHLEHFLY